jgi:hypothetical protein
MPAVGVSTLGQGPALADTQSVSFMQLHADQDRDFQSASGFRHGDGSNDHGLIFIATAGEAKVQPKLNCKKSL